MKDDLVSRQAVKDAYEAYDGSALDKLTVLEWDEIETTILSVPGFELIRCKDCKHYQFADNRAFGMPVKMCAWFGFEDVDDGDYCSFAERRSDE